MKKYLQFIKENIKEEIEDIISQADILESIVTDSDSLLKSVNAEEVNFLDTFKLNADKFTDFMTIEQLYNSQEFNKKLNKIGLKKDQLESTDESETFIEKTIDIKFFLIHKINESEIEQPEYIIFQSRKKGGDWDGIKCYIIKDQIRKFYDKLTSKTIELEKDGKIFIYMTSNGGNNWILQRTRDNQDDNTFKDNLDNKNIKELLKDSTIKITIKE